MSKLSPLPCAILGCNLALLASGSASAAGFLEDSKASVTLRNTYYNDDYREGQGVSKLEEWGQGFQLNYSSGFTQGTVGFGLDAIAQWGIRLDGGGRASATGPGTDFSTNADSRQPTNMFPRNSDGSSVNEFGSLSPAVKMRISKTELRYGVIEPNMPVLTLIDGRLLPQLFEGTQITSTDIDNLKLIGGQIEKVKDRGSSSYDSMKVSGALGDSNKFRYVGGDYQLGKSLTLQYYYGNLEDFYKQHFLGAIKTWDIGPGKLKADLRYFHSRPDGANGKGDANYSSSGFYGDGKTRGKVDNDLYSGLFTYSVGGHAISLGYQQSEGESYFPSINLGAGSGVYLITDGMLGRFGAAGEHAWQARYYYNFAAQGIPGLMAGMHYTRGDNIKANDYERKEFERITFISYTLQNGPLKGLGATISQSMYRTNQTGLRAQDEYKLMVKYEIPIF
ncbi:OprD family outer membrane porin [Pseudomonas kermanshahensis]|uniref:OprD family outer membrane porin n=1 Tax=Pseudomonas kermanshahensis TaxID=2745482 RepID=A0ABU8R6Y5_9PSED